MQRFKAFTLIELLIVIAVIAILVGITVPRFLGMRDEANMAVAAGETSALKAAVEAYRIHKGFFPGGDCFASNCTSWQAELVAMRPQLIESALIDPFNGTTEYTLITSAAANPNYYVILSIGPDDGDQDIVSIDDTTGAITVTGDITEDIYATNGHD